MTFPAYPEYKDSGVEWLGQVPAHWQDKRLKFLFDLCKRGIRKKDSIVTCFRDGTVTLRTNRRTEGFTNALKEIGYQGVRKGDLVIHAMDAFAGAIGVSDSDGKSSPVYSVCSPASRAVSSYYYARLLRHMALSGFVASLAKGIRERSTDFRWSDAAEIFLPVPPYEEQATIAAFLDHEAARIDALVAEQQRLITLLKEKRQAVISHAVTKGIDPDVPMKDSGVEWLGEVPAHWEVMKFLRCVKIAEGQVDPKLEEYREKILIAPNHVESATGRILSLETAESQGAESGKYICQAGDVVYSKIRPALRKACVIDQEVLCSADMYPLRPLEKLTSDYLLWSILSEPFSRLTVLESERVAMPKINRESLNEIFMAVPPVEEQARISGHISQEAQRLDQLTSIATEAIELLSERRSALISAAVTGKIDVRGWTPPADAAPAQQDTRMEAV
ncbi:restriction endonuclease subunit S [Halomonas sp. YLGW01]|uniref:restriction endonuclease subunit S n=1 Tax=Halomonas sp. YLGW01 TaxID=2773308 RepID=UPI00177D0FB4|nr:restriction endonuclease subunit S [Halomonas sp. YLGW01]